MEVRLDELRGPETPSPVSSAVRLFEAEPQASPRTAGAKAPIAVPDGAEEVFEARGNAKKGDSVIHRSGWARELFTSPERVTGKGGAPPREPDILDHLRALSEDDLRSLSREELMDLLGDFESELSEAQLAVVAAIIDEYSDDEGDEDEAAAPPGEEVGSPLHAQGS